MNISKLYDKRKFLFSHPPSIFDIKENIILTDFCKHKRVKIYITL